MWTLHRDKEPNHSCHSCGFRIYVGASWRIFTLSSLVPARNWWKAGPAGMSKVPDGHQRLAWAIASPLLLGLPAEPDMYGSTESLCAAASFIFYDLSALKIRLGKLVSRWKTPSTVWCCSGEERGCSLSRKTQWGNCAAASHT